MSKKTILFAAFLAVSLAACERHAELHANAASPSAQLIGTSPAPPSAESVPANGTVMLRETPETTPVTEQQKELTKNDESQNMPLPGQPNDHSNLSPDASQHAGQSDAQQQPGRSAEANIPQVDNPATAPQVTAPRSEPPAT